MTATASEARTATIDKALLAAEAAQQRKGGSLTVIDVEGRCSYADAIVIASVTNERAAAAIAGAVEDELRTKLSVKPLHREGQGAWILLDYGDVVVHVMVEETRAYYDIDKLWSEAPRVPVPAPAPAEAAATALASRNRG